MHNSNRMTHFAVALAVGLAVPFAAAATTLPMSTFALGVCAVAGVVALFATTDKNDTRYSIAGGLLVGAGLNVVLGNMFLPETPNLSN